MEQNRRNFLKNAAVLTGSALLFTDNSHSMPQSVNNAVRVSRPVEVFINQYTVSTFYAREGINLMENLNSCFAELEKAGFAGFEASIAKTEEVDVYVNALKKHNLQLRSVYTGGNLHEEAVSGDEIKRVIAIAESAKPAGTKIIVLNPIPKSGKSDDELDRQNRNFDILGAELRKMGMVFALHYHTTELEHAAREFHSFMSDTNPKNVSLCYDVHWSYRASNNSAVSAYSHAKLYAGRIAELHLRQSKDGIWTETFEKKADLDYGKTLAILRQSKGFGNCHIVLEQAPEKGTPKTLKPLEIFKQSAEAIQQMFN